MNERDVRMRSIEALASMGIRAPDRLVNDAKLIVDWVMAGEDNADAPEPAPRKPGRKPSADKE